MLESWAQSFIKELRAPNFSTKVRPTTGLFVEEKVVGSRHASRRRQVPKFRSVRSPAAKIQRAGTGPVIEYLH